MGFSRQLFSAIAGASAAYAVSCSTSGTFTVNNQADASGIGSCATYTGSIQINPTPGPTLDFGKIEKITGELSMNTDNQLNTLQLNSLTNIGSLSLTNLTALATLNMPSLTTAGDMTLQNLASLGSWNFGTNLQEAGDVIIENVLIRDLGAFSSASKLNSVTLSNCQFLSNIQFGISEVDTIDIGPNNVQQGQQVVLDQLTTANSLVFRNSTSVNTPMLANVSNTLSLIGNTFTSFGAQNLSWVGALVFADNAQVTNISFPSLTTINGSNSTLDIQNNTQLSAINGFPNLVNIKNGDAIFAGNIKNISLPALKDVDGALKVDTTESSFDCGPINDLQNKQVVRGSVNCTNGDATPTGSSGSAATGSSSGSGSSSSGSGKSAANTVLPPFLTSGMFAALLAFLV